MTISTFLKKIDSVTTSLQNKKIVILKGGFGEEREASFYTANAVQNELSSHKFRTQKIDPSRQDITKLSYKDVIVFNCLHGLFGETGHVSAILDYLKVPYTFSPTFASALTAQKLFFKSAVRKMGLNAPIDNLDPSFKNKKGYFIHKKISGGGSIGMYIDQNRTTPKGYFTECFVNGRILTLGVLEDRGIYTPLEIVEIKLKKGSFYDQNSKYNDGYSILVPYKERHAASIKNIAKQIFGFVGIKNCGRIDLIEYRGRLFVLEINSVPGLYIGSNMQYSAELAGLSFYELLVWVLDHATYEIL